jgi:adenylate cyclase
MYFLRFKLLPTLVGLLITFLFCWFNFVDHGALSHFTQRINNDIYDLKLKTMQQDINKPAKNLVVIDIDEKSLKNIGRWPWSRNKITLLTDKLQKADATVIAYDVIFSEHEQNPMELLSQQMKKENIFLGIPNYEKLYDKFNYDKQFAAALKKSDTVLGFVITGGKETIGTLPKPIVKPPLKLLNGLPFPIGSGYIAPIKPLESAATAEGFVSYIRDSDGVTRRVPLLMRYKDALYPSLALESTRLYLLYDKIGIKKVAIGGGDYLIDGVSLGKYTIPTDRNGQVYAPLMNIKTIPRISAEDIINGTFKPSLVEGRIALIGFTAKGLTDQVSTPINTALPGVYVHASIIQGILNKRLPQRPDWALGAELSATVIFGVILSFLLPWLSPLWSFISTVISYGVVFGVDWALWNKHYWIINICILLITILTISIFNLLWGFLFEQRLRKKFKRLFGQYVPPDHVKAMIKKSASQQKNMEGESKVMTVLFADIMDFTTIAESLSAQKIKELLNDFFTPISDIILENNGTIDKYVGDQVIAFWGAPIDNPDHQRAAIMTGFQMIEKTDELRKEFEKHNLPVIQTGIGINSGEMNVGDMGSVQRRAYTVLGDNVNLAARLEAITRYYSAQMVVGENTTEGIDDIIFMKLDCIFVKGKTKPVNIFQPICMKSDITDEIEKRVSTYESALNGYLTGDWESALKKFTLLIQTEPDVNLYNIFLQRMEQLDNIPPNNWNGSFERRQR